MHPLLLDDLARIQIAERLRDAEKRRTAPPTRVGRGRPRDQLCEAAAAARSVASITDLRSGPQGSGNTIGTSTPPAA